MGLAQSLYTGLSGLRGHQVRMDVIGNNLSNTNTTGYKTVQHGFQDMLSQVLKNSTAAQGTRGSQNPVAIGLGSLTNHTTRVFTQGNLESSDNALDFAVEGDGFFVMRDGNSTDDLFSRDGSFYLYGEQLSNPATGEVTPLELLGGNGLNVMGYNAVDGAVPAGAALEAVTIPLGQPLAGAATSEVTLAGNLNSNGITHTANSIATGAGTTWESTNALTLNVGHVETSQALWDSNLNAAALDTTDLADIQYVTSGNLVTLFQNLADGDSIDLQFAKGRETMTASFTYGLAGNGTTLADFATWMAGGLGDDGDVTTSRLDGGAMGTLRLAENNANGYTAPAEQAGAYLRSFLATDAGAVDYSGANPPVYDPTTKLSIASNVGSENAIGEIRLVHDGNIISDLFDPDATVNGDVEGLSVSRGIEIYDGASGTVEPKILNTRFTLVNRSGNSSTWRWLADGIDENGAADPNAAFATGLIRFDTVINPATGISQQEVSWLQESAANAATAEDTLVNSILAGASDLAFDLSSMTQFSSPNNIEISEQNGYLDGTMETFEISETGLVSGFFTNGEIRTLGQIALARIPNPNGMDQLGGNLFGVNEVSGDPLYSDSVGGTGIDNQLNGFGFIRQNMLESSNVQLQQEMVNLITTQRGFQANARVITTSDEMLQNLVQLKR